MATYFTLTERRNICPACHAENVLIGSDLIGGMEVCCSRCGSFIGRWSDTSDQLPQNENETLSNEARNVTFKWPHLW